MIIGSGPEGSKTVDLKFKEGYRLVVSTPPAVGKGKWGESGVDMVFLLGVMAA